MTDVVESEPDDLQAEEISSVIPSCKIPRLDNDNNTVNEPELDSNDDFFFFFIYFK